VPKDPLDTLQRPMRDLRISVTDRCNFRCTYCMPKEVFGRDYEFLARDQLLTFEEIARIARLTTSLGATKVRLTGGEPLMRAGLPTLIEMLRAIPGIGDLTMTTNGSLLARRADALAEAGLDRVSVSLDATDDATFRAMNDVEFGVMGVLEGIEAAADAGLGPIKINTVVRRGVNDHAILEMARYFRGSGHIVRFIEFMDVGTTNGWRLDDVVPGHEILGLIDAQFPLEPLERAYPGEVASRYRYADGTGEIGIISSVSAPFCGDCTRLRLSAEGSIYTCLFASAGTDLRELIRSDADDAAVVATLRSVWEERTDRYSEIRSDGTDGWERIEMSYIGG
jgi:cyclic pyranopterin phosphate synthase